MSAMERDGWLSGAIGQALGHYRHKFETEIAALRDKLAEAKAELNSTTAKLHDGINTRFAQLPADEAQQVEQARGELQAATTTLHDEIAALRRELTETTNKLQQRLARLPLVKTWTLGAVAYTGDVFVHDGNVWQAKQDTGQQPGDDHWILLARAGKDGLDGRSPRLRGLFRDLRRSRNSRTRRRLEISRPTRRPRPSWRNRTARKEGRTRRAWRRCTNDHQLDTRSRALSRRSDHERWNARSGARVARAVRRVCDRNPMSGAQRGYGTVRVSLARPLTEQTKRRRPGKPTPGSRTARKEPQEPQPWWARSRRPGG